MKIGGHVSVAGGYTNGLNKTVEIGGNAMQIFASSPRIWAPLLVGEQVIDSFTILKHELEIDPIYFHASYLINMADSGITGEKSRQRILEELQLAEKMEIKGTIIHLGSYKQQVPSILLPSKEDQDEGKEPNSFATLLKNISWVLDRSNQTTYFIIENAGNRKIGWSIDEIGNIISDLKDERLRVCLDTCHLHAAGYDLSTEEKYLRFFSDFDKKIGLERLELFQINDSKDPLGSFRDRHANINEGMIPPSVFQLLVNEDLTRNIPFLLEVPGVEKKGPNKEQVNRFKKFLRA